MKVLSLAIVVMGFLSSTAFAATTVWQCSGANLEGLAISDMNGVQAGAVEWDCFHGGGICQQRSFVQSSRSQNGSMVYQGPYFRLTLFASTVSRNGAYRAHISATDMTDPNNSGRGFSLDEYVSCTRGSGLF
jgi:hypothetical protein